MKITNIQTEPQMEVTFQLSQPITLTKSLQGWDISIPTIQAQAEDPNEAAKELGKQLYLLAEAIQEQDGNFDKIDLTKVCISSIDT